MSRIDMTTIKQFLTVMFQAIDEHPKRFFLGFAIMGLVQYIFLTPSIWPIRAPNNPVVTNDWVFAFLFAFFTGAFLAMRRHIKDKPKVCSVTGGIGSVIGIWGATCPFCTLFILVWLGVPAATGVLSAPFLESYLDLIRLGALAVMIYGMSLLVKKQNIVPEVS
ncbi:MAG: hypothetical protein HYU56_05205 [Candidatus Aenigmarchaeota archaeon]|nr:hypothetical protein [Candidatus Aenigmarchaeota archaeon]